VSLQIDPVEDRPDAAITGGRRAEGAQCTRARGVCPDSIEAGRALPQTLEMTAGCPST